jgi:hypothetical protein
VNVSVLYAIISEPTAHRIKYLEMALASSFGNAVSILASTL